MFSAFDLIDAAKSCGVSSGFMGDLGRPITYMGFFFFSDIQEHLTDVGIFSQGGHLFVEGDDGPFTEDGGWQDFLSQWLNSMGNCNSI